ncbi:ATG16 family protein [Aureispira anguillae]|uniref:ATG16 family protein n=1 Tax=Aureispira anguillae TaxID=2864201 RepID=A0A915YD94_9BACT|nr:ATG16 family protein [Aureispira anguillae]BDS10939.1 ATG16 family protein [Aureispira anguillae]
MTDRERLENLRFFFKKNKTEFSKILGYTTSQSYTNYLSGSNNLSMKMVKTLKEHDPRINIDWILSGQGEMLLSNAPQNTTTTTEQAENSRIELLKKEIQHLNEKLKDKEERLKDKDKLIAILEKSLEGKQK